MPEGMNVLWPEITSMPQTGSTFLALHFDPVIYHHLCLLLFPGPLHPSLPLQFGHGQSNPTYLISVSASGVPGRTTGSRPWQAVLRKKPPGMLLKSAHDVEREYRVSTGSMPYGYTTLLVP